MPANPTASTFQAEQREAAIRKKTPGSVQRYEQACSSLAGGVSSGLRRAARPYPLYFDHGSGSTLIDVDGNSYLDFGLGWGPNILGNAPPAVAAAIAEQAVKGLTYGAQHALEIVVSKRLTELIPCADAVCFANSGTEIVQLALRLARAATGRNHYLKFEGHYHGWSDTVLVSYHPTDEEIERAAGQPVPVGKGQLPPDSVVVAQWNNEAGVRAAFDAYPDEISAIICEPLLCNSGCVPPKSGFLEFLREFTRQRQALLIFDEVITGFRLDLGGAQSFYGVIPDLATYGKAVGAGTPLSILAGSVRYMDLIANGAVIHAGTLNGNPISLAAAEASLEELSRDGGAVYTGLRARGKRLREGLQDILRSNGHQVITVGESPVFQLSFMDSEPANYRDTMRADKQLYSDFALALLDEGILVLPDGRWYLSTAHSDEDIDFTLAAAAKVVS